MLLHKLPSDLLKGCATKKFCTVNHHRLKLPVVSTFMRQFCSHVGVHPVKTVFDQSADIQTDESFHSCLCPLPVQRNDMVEYCGE